jgi:hypothetical protein
MLPNENKNPLKNIYLNKKVKFNSKNGY